MFDLITGELQHAPRAHAAPAVLSVATHAAVASLVFATTVFVASERLPEVRTMMAFVAAPPAPAPPPPPAPMARVATREPSVKPLQTTSAAAPVEAPLDVAPEPLAPDGPEEGVSEGVEGGVEGGVAGGVVGGVALSGIVEAPSPPPQPPPPTEPRPVRVGGSIKEPALLHRVEPIYPALAVATGLEGAVILEAIVDRDGRVEGLRVLRSQGVLDRAALEAVRQWRYSPVLLNGRPEKFILTVVVTFRLEQR